MISVSIWRKTPWPTTRARGLALFDAIAAQQPESDLRRVAPHPHPTVDRAALDHAGAGRIWRVVCGAGIVPRATRRRILGANLYGAVLRCKPPGANLGGADLGGANLYRAVLSVRTSARTSAARISRREPRRRESPARTLGANLSGADLLGANLRRRGSPRRESPGANLYLADLTPIAANGQPPIPGWAHARPGLPPEGHMIIIKRRSPTWRSASCWCRRSRVPRIRRRQAGRPQHPRAGGPRRHTCRPGARAGLAQREQVAPGHVGAPARRPARDMTARAEKAELDAAEWAAEVDALRAEALAELADARRSATPSPSLPTQRRRRRGSCGSTQARRTTQKRGAQSPRRRVGRRHEHERGDAKAVARIEAAFRKFVALGVAHERARQQPAPTFVQATGTHTSGGRPRAGQGASARCAARRRPRDGRRSWWSRKEGNGRMPRRRVPVDTHRPRRRRPRARRSGARDEGGGGERDIRVCEDDGGGSWSASTHRDATRNSLDASPPPTSPRRWPACSGRWPVAT